MPEALLESLQPDDRRDLVGYRMPRNKWRCLSCSFKK